MRVTLAALTILALAACANGAAVGQTGQIAAQVSPCAASEFRQMDFWVGTWDVRWNKGGGTPAGAGTNIITREYADCVIQEAFDGGPATGNLIGHSVSTYHAPLGKWRQTWVDNQGGYFALIGGPEGDDFVLTSYRVSDNTPAQRMVFTDIGAHSLTWRWQRTTDSGATWSDSWVIYYTRRPG